MGSQVTERIRARKGDAAAAVYESFLADPELSALIIENPEKVDDPAKNLEVLKDACAGKVPVAAAVEPLRGVCTSICRVAGVQMVGSKAVMAERAQEEGLTEALEQAVELKKSHGVLLSGFRVNVPIWTARTTQIILWRSLSEVLAGVQRSVAFALNEAEVSAAKELRASFGDVRSLVASQIPDGEHEHIVEYLYGSAVAGAARNKENQAKFKALEERAAGTVTLATKREAREEAARDMDALARELRAPVKAPEKP